MFKVFSYFRCHGNNIKLRKFSDISLKVKTVDQFLRHKQQRLFSTSHSHRPKEVKFITEEEAVYFKSLFPILVQDLISTSYFKDQPDVANEFSSILEYNVPYGKKVNAFIATALYKEIEDPCKLTSENVRLINILGWCIQLLHTSYILTDDVQDASLTRRGAPCWYLVNNTGLRTITDASWMQFGIFAILKKYFQSHRCYIPLMEMFNEIGLEVAMGQSLDLFFTRGGSQIGSYNKDRYDYLINYKTAPLFKFPIGSALYLSGVYDQELIKEGNRILLEIGKNFQIQNDYLDCFGDKSVAGNRVGNDIQEGKFTWLIMEALRRASPAQKALLEAHYGKVNDDSVLAVRTVYEELDLPNLFITNEIESYNRIKSQIDKMSTKFPRRLFMEVLEGLHIRPQ